jgi:hypothetical protein
MQFSINPCINWLHHISYYYINHIIISFDSFIKMNIIHKPKALRVKTCRKPKNMMEVKVRWEKKKKLNKFHPSYHKDGNCLNQIEKERCVKHSDECDLCWKCHKILGSYEEYVCFDCKIINFDKRVPDDNMRSDNDNMRSDNDNMRSDDDDMRSDDDNCGKLKKNKIKRKPYDKNDEYNIEYENPLELCESDMECCKCNKILGLYEDITCYECKVKQNNRQDTFI